MADTESYLILEFTVNKSVTAQGSVRVDLLGGTLDLNPINVILPNVVTLNLATSLKAKVNISYLDFDGVEVVSRDYNSTDRFKSSDFSEDNFQKGFFGLEIIKSFVSKFEFADLYNIDFLCLYFSNKGDIHLTGSRSMSE